MVYLGKTEILSSDDNLSLREERKRTGRFIAVGTAIFLSLLGLYQALIRGTPEYAALFAPALIMFIYIAWVLYISTNKRRIMKEENTALTEMSMNTVESVCVEVEEEPEKIKEEGAEKNNSSRITYNRSYSIG